MQTAALFIKGLQTRVTAASQKILAQHPVNLARREAGKREAATACSHMAVWGMGV